MVWQIDLNAANKRSLGNLTTVLANGWTDIWTQALFSHSPFRGSMCEVWLCHQSPYLALLLQSLLRAYAYNLHIAISALPFAFLWSVTFWFPLLSFPYGLLCVRDMTKGRQVQDKGFLFPKKNHVISCRLQGVSVCVSSRRLSSCTWLSVCVCTRAGLDVAEGLFSMQTQADVTSVGRWRVVTGACAHVVAPSTCHWAFRPRWPARPAPIHWKIRKRGHSNYYCACVMNNFGTSILHFFQ